MYLLSIFCLILKTLFERIICHYFVTGDIGGGGSTELDTKGDKKRRGFKICVDFIFEWPQGILGNVVNVKLYKVT